MLSGRLDSENDYLYLFLAAMYPFLIANGAEVELAHGPVRQCTREARMFRSISRAAWPVAVAMAAGGCTGSSVVRSSAAPPLIICGTTLSRSASGPVLRDATRGPARITNYGARLFIRVSADCAHGTSVTWHPQSAATLVGRANARDGLPVVVVLQPETRQSRFTVTGLHNGRRNVSLVVAPGHG